MHFKITLILKYMTTDQGRMQKLSVGMSGLWERMPQRGPRKEPLLGIRGSGGEVFPAGSWTLFRTWQSILIAILNMDVLSACYAYRRRWVMYAPHPCPDPPVQLTQPTRKRGEDPAASVWICASVSLHASDAVATWRVPLRCLVLFTYD